MKIIGLVGWSGSGKTTLLTELLPLLRSAGLSVSTVKHTHHGFDMDRPGKDSYRHREAGAHEVMVVIPVDSNVQEAEHVHQKIRKPLAPGMSPFGF